MNPRKRAFGLNRRKQALKRKRRPPSLNGGKAQAVFMLVLTTLTVLMAAAVTFQLMS